MKYINNVKIINRILFGITIVLYITVFLGLAFQIVLGAYQILIALLLLSKLDQLSVTAKKNLYTYLSFVIFFGVCFGFNLFDKLKDLWFFPYIVVPMIFAVCFTIFLEELKLAS